PGPAHAGPNPARGPQRGRGGHRPKPHRGESPLRGLRRRVGRDLRALRGARNGNPTPSRAG
nr:hypothetical protein [Tanacetum cinerariifolium]